MKTTDKADIVYNLGIDIGSTTIKFVVLDDDDRILFCKYKRHNAGIRQSLCEFFQSLRSTFVEASFKTVITGSVGMGYADRFGIPFAQEVIAAAKWIQTKEPKVHTFVDIGGEDSKIVFFEDGRIPEIRMNGNCAGGTGAFIDQMAMLMNLDIADFNALAASAETIHPIASRCGVFSKTDVQNLLSRNIGKNDIAASVLNAVAMQVISSLARGSETTPLIYFCGGPFTFIPVLKQYFQNILHLDDDKCIIPENSQFIPALGCALMAKKQPQANINILKLLYVLQFEDNTSVNFKNRLPALFASADDFQRWKDSRRCFVVDAADIAPNTTYNCYLGVDSGSTTTKIVLIDQHERLLYHDYHNNEGDSFNTFLHSMETLQELLCRNHSTINIVGSAVTGYGENLLKTAFGLDYGIVETMAHFSAAKHVLPDVSFVLDIGGQDMKAMFVENGSIRQIEINEACSSGCGSFIETFANMLNYPVAEFANIACGAKAPCDLGTRCTVFMNSKVKQSLREGANIDDIAAGFSYSVIKNCLFKVLKISNIDELGDKIVVQGGTFKNLSIVRALELLTGKSVSSSNIPELMGAYGAALYAKTKSTSADKTVNIDDLIRHKTYTSTTEQCPGCENHCTVKVFNFENGNVFYSGNNCEKVYSNRADPTQKGINLHVEKYKKAIRERRNYATGEMTIGIPRALEIYEHYPFWHTLFNECNIRVELSGPSTNSLYESGIRTIMSDNICFPAKLMHGHIFDLIRRGVKRIFYPYVVYETKEDKRSQNSYNCPIVAGYSDVIRSAIDPEANFGVQLDSPIISFNNDRLLRKSCVKYLTTLGIGKSLILKALRAAFRAQEQFETSLATRTQEVIESAVRENRLVIVLAGRPYHIDPMIQHKISRAISEMGIDVVTENVSWFAGEKIYGELHSVSQWAFPNRIFKAAHYVAQLPANVQFVELTSFGCGPDAFILDEARSILNRSHKNLTVLKIDDVNNIGSLRLRVRSLVESLDLHRPERANRPFCTTPPFTDSDRRRTIIAPYFAEGYSEYLPSLFKVLGYNFVNLPKGDSLSTEAGLKYANNDICYPATIVIGNIIHELQSGKYDRNKVAVAITQTGGQCRASNYLSLIKNAMINAGFDDIPVVSVSVAKSSNNAQQGFRPNYLKHINIIFNTLLYADCISKLYYPAVVREKYKGAARSLRAKYINDSFSYIENSNVQGLRLLLKAAVKDFNKIVAPGERKKIGIVGEIYLKYNAFSNKFVFDWLIDKNFEVVVPSIYNFFTNSFINAHFNKENNIRPVKFPLFFTDKVNALLCETTAKYDDICKPFCYYRSFGNLYEEGRKAVEIVSPAANFGEGWLLPAEIVSFAESGINNVISLQPFGCIANHVISKGIEKRIKKLFPQMNLLFLDFDAGTSEANIFNRLHFMANNDL